MGMDPMIFQVAHLRGSSIVQGLQRGPAGNVPACPAQCLHCEAYQDEQLIYGI